MTSIHRIASSWCAIALLAGCAGASQENIPAAHALSRTGKGNSANAKHVKTRVRVTIRIPRETHRDRDRRGHYVSAATKSMTIAFTGAGTFTRVVNLTAENPGCTGTPLTCTANLALLSGSYVATVDTYDKVPVAGVIPASAKLLSTAVAIPFVMKGGITNTVGFTLDGVPASFAITPPAGTAGTAFSSAAFNVAVDDADGNTIVGTFATPVTLAILDPSNSTTLATSGSDNPPAGELLSSGDAAALSYNGFPVGPRTISATATGATTGSVNFAPTISESVIFSLDPTTSGQGLQSGLAAIGSELYGVALFGGTNNDGTVFHVSTSGTGGVLYPFAGGLSDGSLPDASMLAVNGNLYGTTYAGGAYGGGTFFEITPAGVETMLYSFGNGSDASGPESGLVAIGGELYGTTLRGGTGGNGTVYEITTAGVENVLYNFAGGLDAAYPSTLIAVNEELYGTSSAGGANGDGAVFKVSTSGTESVMHSFGSGTDGQNPVGGLVAIGNELYGGTSSGGVNCCQGMIFEISTLGTYRPVYNFQYGADGNGPIGELVAVGNELYGATGGGGSSGNGSVFEVSPAGIESVLYSFGSGSDAQLPVASVIVVGGNLYGSTTRGGANSTGAIYEIP